MAVATSAHPQRCRWCLGGDGFLKSQGQNYPKMHLFLKINTIECSVGSRFVSETMTEPLEMLCSVWKMFSICVCVVFFFPFIILIADSVLFQIYGTEYLMVL